MRIRRLSIRYGFPEPGLFQLPWNAHVPMPIAQRHWRPPVDSFETADELCVRVELAGMREEEIQVTLYADTLVIEGERRWEGLACEQSCCHAAEIRYGPFRLELPVGKGLRADGLELRYEQGLLLVRLPKSAEATR